MTNSPLRYTVLWHAGIARPHFDLLVETTHRRNLSTWRCPIWPIDRRRILQQLPDHRRLYLDYNGPLPDHGGFVRPVETGICRIERPNDARWLIYFNDAPAPLLLARLASKPAHFSARFISTSKNQ